MKIHGVIIKDEQGTFFAFIKQFPGICAQGSTQTEVQSKINAYYRAFIDQIKDKDVELEEKNMITM